MPFLVEHLPPQVHLVLASRADPPLPLARLRARGELLEIRAADLRFTADEAADVPQRRDGPAPRLPRRRRPRGPHRGVDRRAAARRAVDAGPRRRRRLHRRASPATTASSSTTSSRRCSTASPTTSGRFLLETADPDRLTGPLCDAVTGRSGGKATLEQLDRANLFLVPLDDRRLWYRYHHLFADVLRARLIGRAARPGARAAPAGERLVRAPAATDPRRSRHAMAGARLRARRRAHRAGRARYAPGPPGRDAASAGSRPSPTRCSPTGRCSSIGLVGARMATGDIDRRRGAPRQRRALARRRDRRRRRSDRVRPRRVRPPPGAGRRCTAPRSRCSPATSPAPSPTPTGRSSLPSRPTTSAEAAPPRCSGSRTGPSGDLEPASAGTPRRSRASSQAGYFADVLGCSLALPTSRSPRAGSATRHDTFEAGLDLADGHTALRGTADMHVGLERGAARAQRARRRPPPPRRPASSSASTPALPQHAYRWRVALARLRQARGRPRRRARAARRSGARLQHRLLARRPPGRRRQARAAAGRRRRRRRAAVGGRPRLTADDELSYLHEFEHITLARVLLAGTADRDPAARRRDRLLDRLLAAAEEGQREGSAIEILVAAGARPSTPAATDRGRARSRSSEALRRAPSRRATSASSSTRARR